MLIKQLWKKFKADFEYQNAYGKYRYSNKEIVNILLLSIFLTPFYLFIDILFSPLELIYLLLLKIIEKKRKEVK